MGLESVGDTSTRWIHCGTAVSVLWVKGVDALWDCSQWVMSQCGGCIMGLQSVGDESVWWIHSGAAVSG